MRPKVMNGLVQKARVDREFRSKAVAELEQTLDAYGFELTDDELAAVREFHEHAAALSDAELEEQLAGDVSGHAA
jgi:hypothetical protein